MNSIDYSLHLYSNIQVQYIYVMPHAPLPVRIFPPADWILRLRPSPLACVCSGPTDESQRSTVEWSAGCIYSDPCVIADWPDRPLPYCQTAPNPRAFS